MASSLNYFPLFLFLAVLGLTQARNSQFFNKIPATNNIDPPNYTQQDPNFLPENGNGYGLDHQMSEQEQEQEQLPSLTDPSSTDESKQTAPSFLPENGNGYGHHMSEQEQEQGQGQEQLPSLTDPSITDESKQTAPNFLPDDFNPVAHLIQPDHLTAPQMAFPAEPNGNSYYNGGDIFNGQPEGFSNFNGGRFRQQQGMSDTRFLENGKYFYDVNTDRYSSNHPYEKLRPKHDYSNMNYYYHYNGDNRGDAYGFGNESSMWGTDQTQDKFQGQENIP